MGYLQEPLWVIVNPVSGTADKRQVPVWVEKYLAKAYPDIRIVQTEAAGHARELAQQALASGAGTIASVGGDGTMNEVASVLTGTSARLAVIPTGSGNGLVRSLALPSQAEKAIALLAQADTLSIDTCYLNHQPFFCAAGVGFDAVVAHQFAQLGTRGLSSYIKSTLAAYRTYQPESYALTFHGRRSEHQALMVTVANAGQFGNNAWIAPEADVADGHMDICVVNSVAPRRLVPLALKLFTRSLARDPDVDYYLSDRLVIERSSEGPVHYDGEPALMPARLEFSVKPQSLQVAVTARPVRKPAFEAFSSLPSNL